MYNFSGGGNKKRKLAVRIVCGVLAFAMIISMLVAVF